MKIAGAGGGGHIKAAPKPNTAPAVKGQPQLPAFVKTPQQALAYMRRGQNATDASLRAQGYTASFGNLAHHFLSTLGRATIGVDPYHPLDGVRSAHQLAVKIAHPSPQNPPSLGQNIEGLLAGSFGLPQMRVGAPEALAAARELKQPGRMYGNFNTSLPPDKLFASKAVVPAYHGTRAAGYAIGDAPLNENTISRGWFTTNEASARSHAVGAQGPLAPHVVKAALAMRNPLYLKADPELNKMDGIFAKLANSAHQLQLRGLIPNSHAATSVAGDAIKKIQYVEATRGRATVNDLVSHYVKEFGQEGADKILRHAGYDAVVNEAQPALRQVDLANPDGPGKILKPVFNIRPLNYHDVVHDIRAPGELASEAVTRLRAFDTLLQHKIESARTGATKLTPQQLRTLTSLAQRASAKLALYKGADNPEVTFHGSQNVIPKVNMKKSKDQSLYGPGFYTTNDPEIAASYVDKEQGNATIGKWITGKTRDEAVAKLGAYRTQNKLIPTNRIQVRQNSDGSWDAGQGFYDPTHGPSVRMQRIITKKPFDVRNEATVADKRAIMRALRDGFQQGKRQGNAMWNGGDYRPPGYGSYRKLLKNNLPQAIYPPRLSDYEGRFHGGAGLDPSHSMKGMLKNDRAERRDFGLMGEIWGAPDLERVYQALQAHVGSPRLINHLIRKAGYDSIRHEGGRLMGGATHDVTIALSRGHVRNPHELPVAQKVLKEALDTLGQHVGKGRFTSDLEKREFLRAYVEEALGIVAGKRSLQSTRK